MTLARLRRACTLAALPVLAYAALGCRPAPTTEAQVALTPCRLTGLSNEVRCGVIDVDEAPEEDREPADKAAVTGTEPADKAAATGPDPVAKAAATAPEPAAKAAERRIKIHFAVVPALAKHKEDDPIFILPGGPGQAATRIAGQVMPLFARLNARRDIVFVDQRGTGGSHPLMCDDDSGVASLANAVDLQRQVAQLGDCMRKLDADPRHYATWIAVRDLDQVRAALGYRRINLWGASYGTRAALEYVRQFPQHVRSATLDGVAPADMRLPASFALDADAALTALIERCRADAACRATYPHLAEDIAALFAQHARAASPASARSAPLAPAQARAEAPTPQRRPAQRAPAQAAGAPQIGGSAAATRLDNGALRVADPLSGAIDTLPLTPETFATLLRTPLYVPQFAALLPHAVARAKDSDYGALFALLALFRGNDATRIAWGQHFAVICAEDVPRITNADRAAAAATRFGTAFIDLYAQACAQVPQRPAPAAFYQAPAADVPVLMLSGGADPATPPRHADAIARTLPRARHLIAPQLGHGISGQGCAPDLIARFVRQASFEKIDGACLERIPAPTFFAPIVTTRPPPRTEATPSR